LKMGKSKYWIQKAIKRPGALKAWLKRNKEKVRRATGESPLTREGKVKVSVLKKFRNTKTYKKLSTSTKHRINLAIKLHKYRPRK